MCAAAPYLPALPVAGSWWWCPGLVAVVWLSSARFFAGRGCGNFHRCGCSLDVGLWPLVVGSCPAVMWWPLVRGGDVVAAFLSAVAVVVGVIGAVLCRGRCSVAAGS